MTHRSWRILLQIILGASRSKFYTLFDLSEKGPYLPITRFNKFVIAPAACLPVSSTSS